MYRVLKPNGTIYLQFPHFTSEKVFKLFVRYAESGSRHIARVRCYTIPEIKKILNSLGFETPKILTEGTDIIVTAKKP